MNEPEEFVMISSPESPVCWLTNPLFRDGQDVDDEVIDERVGVLVSHYDLPVLGAPESKCVLCFEHFCPDYRVSTYFA